jgi:hypothetical protein
MMPTVEPQRSTSIVIGHALVAAVALSFLLGFFAVYVGAVGIVGCVLYIIVGTLVQPKPDLDNLGLLGGLIDHPLRLRDNLNRFLLFLLIILMPGRFIGTGILGLVYWLATKARRG